MYENVFRVHDWQRAEPQPARVGSVERDSTLSCDNSSTFRTCIWRGLRTLVPLVLCTLLMSCASSALLRQKKLADAVASEDFISAVSLVRQNQKELYGKRNALLYHMDMGVLYHYAGQYDSSNAYLLKAVEINDDLFARSITNESAALLTNDNIRPYRAKPYELVLIHQIIALNFLALGKVDEALVESRSVQLQFNEWERKGANTNKYHTDGMFHLLSSIAYEELGETDNSLISLFKSVQAYKKGPVNLPEEVREYAYNRLVSGGRESDTAILGIRAPQGEIEWNAGKDESEIILVGYAGKGPTLQEKSWSGTYIKDGMLMVSTVGPDGRMVSENFPAPSLPASEYQKAARGQKTQSGTTIHIKFAMPEVATFPSRASYFTVQQGSNATIRSVKINDLNLQAKKALQDNWNSMMTRTVVRVVLRTIAAQRAKAEMRTDSPVANLLLNLGTDVLTDQLERADIRSCFLLPQEIHLLRMPVQPGKHDFLVNVHDRYGNLMGVREYRGIEVKKGEKKFLFHYSFK